MSSIQQKTKKTSNVRMKLIRVCTLPANKKRYLGTFTLLKMDAFAYKLRIPKLDDSENQQKSRFPQKRYVVKCSIERPKNCPNTTFITNSISRGDMRLHPMPSTVRLYFFLKSRLTSSSKRN